MTEEARRSDDGRGDEAERLAPPTGRRPEPCTVVIFGASGDLTARMLVPSLLALHRAGELAERFAILGVARTELTDESFRERVRPDGPDGDGEEWDAFARHLHYEPLRYDAAEDYERLASRLREVSDLHGTGGNRLFNLAVPPSLTRTVAVHLAEAGLAADGGASCTRLVVEKPFGHDLASARRLDEAIARGFREDQVFRIDHYLAKESVQNVLMFRFANSIFEPIWSRSHVEWVRITATETLGVEHRAGYYESAGVLRDMMQNHMMQLLAMVASDPPSAFEAERVRDERVRLFRCLRPFPVERRRDHLVLGQYGAGRVDGRPVPAYRDEPGVEPGSLTPTYAAMRVFVDNWRWQGVPFYLESGKRLARKQTRIDMQFRPVPHSVFRDVLGGAVAANRLTFGISPREEIVLSLQGKRPGARPALRPIRLRFDALEGGDGPGVDAYGKALGDAMLGDHTLFWRQDALELAWAFFEPLIAACETCSDRGAALDPYEAGSLGPEEARGRLPPLEVAG